MLRTIRDFDDVPVFLTLLLVTDNIGEALEHIRTHAVEQFGLVERSHDTVASARRAGRVMEQSR